MKTSRWCVGCFATVGLLLGLMLRAAASPLPAVVSLAELQGKIEAHVTQPKFAGAAWGVKIASLDTGRTLYEHAANQRLSPASNSKLYSAALALDQLGADYRMRTPILASAAVDAAGELKGNLIVSGRGDPSWDPRRLKKDFMTVFEPFVAAVKKAGVRRITGDVVADATYFHSTPQGGSWAADDMNDYYGAEISAITVDDNYVDLHVAPGAMVGAPCVIDVLQPLSGLTLDNRTRTIAAGGSRNIRVLRVPGETAVQVFGELPLGEKAELTEATVPRPSLWFATGLKVALEHAGITVGGGARGVRWPEVAPTAPGDVKLGEVVSTPLREFLPVMMKQSQNLQADLIFAYVGESRRVPSTPAWTRSEDLALAGLKEFLERHALRPEDVIFDEGSGLSRNNLTTAAATVALLQFMAKHRDAAVFADSLPIAGVDGTLRRRMKGTPAEGNIHAKTGTLRWTTALSGYVNSAAGERLAFSLMLNRYEASPGHSASQELDAIAVLLARYSGAR
jgi:D-alanyl-D-alanine carboxypeptidase/D-alanyl-D-alanine-endopeptidase (penicillin-binding protein 4)